MQEEKHIYSSSLLKRIEDFLGALKKEVKTYFEIERKKKELKTVIPDKPLQPSPSSVGTISSLKILPKEMSSEDIKKDKPKPKTKGVNEKTVLFKSPGIKSITIKKSYTTYEKREKILVIGLLASILFFIILGIFLSSRG